MSYPLTLELIGGNGGSEFSFTGESNGASLEKIWVWVGGWQVKAVKVWLSDGRMDTFGEPDGFYEEYKFCFGECFTSLSLCGNGAGTRLGAIRFKTTQGGEFFTDSSSWDLKNEHQIDVGSGYCLGVVGRSGADIDCMGFMFLNAVESLVLTNVSYPTIHQLIPQVVVEEIDHVTYENSSFLSLKQIATGSKKITKKSVWCVQRISFQFKQEVMAGIPEVGEVAGGFEFRVGIESTYGQLQTEEKTVSRTTEITVPPGKKVEVDISIGCSTFDMPYTGTMKITCKNGSVLQYKTMGAYIGASYTDIKVNTKETGASNWIIYDLIIKIMGELTSPNLLPNNVLRTVSDTLSSVVLVCQSRNKAKVLSKQSSTRKAPKSCHSSVIFCNRFLPAEEDLAEQLSSARGFSK